MWPTILIYHVLESYLTADVLCSRVTMIRRPTTVQIIHFRHPTKREFCLRNSSLKNPSNHLKPSAI